MKPGRIHIGRLFLASALAMLCAGLALGVIASQAYLFPGFLKDRVSFAALRPMHVTAVIYWILMGATGAVYSSLEKLTGKRPGKLAFLQWLLWVTAGAGIFICYLRGQFGGREYWEFPPAWALPLAAAWMIFIVNFIRMSASIRRWPVYMWMWMTGTTFFLFTFAENYLWIFPYFRENFVADMTIQWKVNGSLVGCWNQLIYGTAFFLMDRIKRSAGTGFSRLAFAMYFLGLFNLMFNWGHHIYTLPTEAFVRYVGYGVSMTEWIIFARIVYLWRSTVTDVERHEHNLTFRFLVAADIWVFINLTQALFMSIPALNRYTHGTHVTVAHAMGTTIGINTMILFAACFEFFRGGPCDVRRPGRQINVLFWTAQFSLLVFWISLTAAGVVRGFWQMGDRSLPFNLMMEQLRPAFVLFAASGAMLMISLGGLALILLRRYVNCDWKEKNTPNISQIKKHEPTYRTTVKSIGEPA